VTGEEIGELATLLLVSEVDENDGLQDIILPGRQYLWMILNLLRDNAGQYDVTRLQKRRRSSPLSWIQEGRKRRERKEQIKADREKVMEQRIEERRKKQQEEPWPLILQGTRLSLERMKIYDEEFYK